jgi:nitroreductase
MQAPSAGNQQPWEFVVVRDKEILKSVPSFHPFALVPIGFAKNERKQVQSRYNESKIRLNKWKV